MKELELKILRIFDIQNKIGIFIPAKLLSSSLRPFIHGGKDQHKSCTAHHGEPLLCQTAPFVIVWTLFFPNRVANIVQT